MITYHTFRLTVLTRESKSESDSELVSRNDDFTCTAFAIHKGRMARGIVQKRNNRDILRSRDLFGSAPKN